VDSRVVAADAAVVGPIARAVLAGRLAFVLGGDKHRIQLIEELADNFNVSGFLHTERLRTVVASHSPEAVLGAVKQLVASANHASVTCRFVAALPGFLRDAGLPEVAPQLVFSTDYGTMLEQSFEAAGEPFHLLYFMSSGDDQGRFMHRALDGALRVIERPERVAPLSPRVSVVVKLRGGALCGGDARGRHVSESICLEDRDIAWAAFRAMDALPRAIQLDLRARQLLLLGYGLLGDPDGDALARERGATSPGESWAFHAIVDLKVRDYWAGHGVRVLEQTADAAVLGLHAELSEEAGPEVVGDKP
jgi:hypothetical protein